MKLTINIELEQYKDGSLEMSTDIDPHGQPPDTKLSNSMALLIMCIAAGLEVTVDAFKARSPGLHVTHRDGLTKFKRA